MKGLFLLCAALAFSQDPATDALAQRLLDSEIGARISRSSDPAQRLDDIRRWIQDSPESAAQVATGLAQDDARGDHAFEETVLRSTNRTFEINEDHVDRSVYGHLKKSSSQSKLMDADAKMMDEEKREILKNMFEGQGGMSNQIVTPKSPGKPGPGIPPDYYDRLSRLNLSGYSPQVLAIQSALNQHRVPGAPKLAETGKLDYETLSYPAHAMRYDLDTLQAHLRLQQDLELSRLAGLDGRYTAAQLLNPKVEEELKKKAVGYKPSARMESRRQALERADSAARDFEAAAEPAKKNSLITPSLLIALGERQREAARWITAASLEGEIQDLENVEGFLSPELRTAIDGCPLPAPMREAYKRRGEDLSRTLAKMKSNAQDSLRRLESPDWQRDAGAITAVLAQNAAWRKNLALHIQDFTQTPWRLRAFDQNRPRWRRMLEDALRHYLPTTSWGRRLNRRQAQRESLKDIFIKIASGDMDAAHAILISL